MPSTAWTQDLGAVSASSVAGIKLDDRADLPRSSVIKSATIRNSSGATLRLVNHPGTPIVDPGERIKAEDCGRYLNFENDAVAIAAGQVLVNLVVEWP
ncbi:MAG: hypothetical protein QOG31_217 [Thermoplasmata archaeon]|nr:hypothetical protein [Thermoplasmata archaeon]